MIRIISGFDKFSGPKAKALLSAIYDDTTMPMNMMTMTTMTMTTMTMTSMGWSRGRGRARGRSRGRSRSF